MNANLPLRDIHLPDGIPWWPPAPGWWLLLATVAAAALIIWFLWRNRGQRSLHQQALQELERIENRFGQQDDARQALANLSALLRRVAVSRYPRAQVASLTGRRWLQFLDGVTGADEFSDGPGRVLADAPYNPAPRADNLPDLIELCRRWLEAEFRRRMDPDHH